LLFFIIAYTTLNKLFAVFYILSTVYVNGALQIIIIIITINASDYRPNRDYTNPNPNHNGPYPLLSV